MTNSRDKGARGERDAAAAWAQAVGGQARRGQQFAGGTDSPDVVCSQENIHLEVKRTERGNPYLWMEQAVRDAGPKVPLVLHRRNGQDWLAIVRLSDVTRLAAAIDPKAAPLGEQPISDPVPGEGHPEVPKGHGEHAGVLPVRRRREGSHRHSRRPGQRDVD